MPSVPILSNLGGRAILRVRKGIEFGPHSIVIRNPDRTLIDPTGSTFQGQIRGPDGLALTEFDCATVISATETGTFGLSEVKVALLSVGPTLLDPLSQHTFDLEWIDSLGKKRILCRGVLQTEADV